MKMPIWCYRLLRSLAIMFAALWRDAGEEIFTVDQKPASAK
jgi:hypothetical protein